VRVTLLHAGVPVRDVGPRQTLGVRISLTVLFLGFLSLAFVGCSSGGGSASNVTCPTSTSVSVLTTPTGYLGSRPTTITGIVCPR